MENKILDLRYVNEIISDDDIKTFYKHDVFISSQTGTGKTRFILGDNEKLGLIDKIGNKKVLYLYNRKQLGLQIKKDLLNKYNMEILNDKELDKLDTIKSTTVMSYQKLEYEILKHKAIKKEFDVDEYDYIICDEAHYFLTDSDFNNNVEHSFQLLINGWCGIVCNRIFISATMDEVKELFKKEAINPIEFTSGIDYSYLNVKYFKKDSTIVNLIRNDKSDDKWLVFVSSKKEGINLKNELKQYGISCEYMDAKTKESYIKNESFDCSVLICTKVLDNGVNINDKKVNNIVINSFSKVDLIQELGRLRINIKSARLINLYINAMDGQKFQRQLNTVLNLKTKQLEKYKNDNTNFKIYYNSNPNKLYKSLFRIDNGIELNELGVIKLENDLKYFKYMCEKFKTDGKYAYVKEVLSWLKLEETFSEDNFLDDKVISNDSVENLSKLLDSVIGQKILEDTQKKISDSIKRDFNGIKNNIDYRTKKASVATLNSILQNDLKLNYMISSKRTSKRVDGVPKKYVYWTVVKIED